MPGHGGKFMQKTIGEPPGYRQLVFALELLNRHTCRLVKSPGCAQLTVAEFREGTLHRGDARGRGDGRSNEIADRIIAAGGTEPAASEPAPGARAPLLWAFPAALFPETAAPAGPTQWDDYRPPAAGPSDWRKTAPDAGRTAETPR